MTITFDIKLELIVPNVSTVSSESDGTHDLPSRYIFTLVIRARYRIRSLFILIIPGRGRISGKTHKTNKQQQQQPEVDGVNVSTKRTSPCQLS